jgi:hypothetical protein
VRAPIRVLALLAVLCSAQRLGAMVITHTLDPAAFMPSRVTDPAGTTTFVEDRLTAIVPGPGGTFGPAATPFTIQLAMRPGWALEADPSTNMRVSVAFGTPHVSGGVSNQTSGVGTVTLTGSNVNTLPISLRSEHYTVFPGSGAPQEQVFANQLIQSIPAGPPARVTALSWQFNSQTMLSPFTLPLDSFRFEFRAFRSIASGDVATHPPLVHVTQVPEPTSTLAAATCIVIAAQRRRSHLRPR